MRCIHFGELVDHDHVADQVEAGPSEVLGPRNAEQPQLSHLPDTVPGKGGLFIVLGGNRRDLVASELPYHLAHLMMLFAEVERVVHDDGLLVSVRAIVTTAARAALHAVSKIA